MHFGASAVGADGRRRDAGDAAAPLRAGVRRHAGVVTRSLHTAAGMRVAPA